MADSTIIKEWLISVGFVTDETKRKRTEEGIDSFGKTIEGLGKAAAAMAVVVAGAVTEAMDRLEDLYFMSRRTGASAQNIQAFGFAMSQVGSSSQGAKAAIEGLAASMRNNPGVEGLLNGLGVNTREANGQMADTEQIMVRLGRALSKLPTSVGHQYADMLGIDDKTFLALRDGSYERELGRYNAMVRASGVDMQRAAAQGHEFMTALRIVQAQIELLATSAIQQVDNLFHRFAAFAASAQGNAFFAPLRESLGEFKDFAEGVEQYLGSAFTDIAEKVGPALLVLIRELGEALLVVADILTGRWGKAWSDLGKLAHDAIGAIVSDVRLASKVISDLWFTATHHGQAPPSAGGSVPSARPAAVNDNAQGVMKALMGMGWTMAQAAGIAANLWRESGFNASARGDHGQAYGVAQWHPDRQADFAKWSGHDIRQSTLGEQLAFLNYELRKGSRWRAGGALMGAGDAASAATIVSRMYEAPKDVQGEAVRRAAEATSLMGQTTLGGAPGGGQSVTVNTDITVNGVSDPQKAANAVTTAQTSVANQTARNFRTAAQ